MVKASELYRKGEFNTAEYITKGDITVIRIFKHGWKKPHIFKVKNLGRKNQKIIEDEDVLEK